MNKFIVLALAGIALLGAAPVHAQSTSAIIVASCGTPPTTYSAGQNRQVTQDTTGKLCTGATTTPSGTQDMNLKQVNGATVNVGAGAAGTGTQRVTTSTDSTIGAVTAITNALPAGANVIGHVIADTGSTTAVTGNVTVVQPTGTNLHAVLDTTSTTAVTQATAANLNATVVGTGTFAVQSSQAPSAASTAGVAATSSSALAANTVVKASAGNLYSFEVSADSTLSAAAWWIMIYNATSAPGDGAVTPLKCYALPTGTTAFSGAFPIPLYLSTGITIGVSTTGCFSKTSSTHAFISGDSQ